MKVYMYLPRLFLILAYYCAQSERKKATKRRDSALLSFAKLSGMGHLHDDVILLLQSESFGVLLSCANFKGICFLNLAGITKLRPCLGMVKNNPPFSCNLSTLFQDY